MIRNSLAHAAFLERDREREGEGEGGGSGGGREGERGKLIGNASGTEGGVQQVQQRGG